MPKRILLIEDDHDLAEIYLRVLEKAGYDVLHAEDGESGYDMALEHEPDLILLDIMLPKKQGLTILKELRNTPKSETFPVYIVSMLGDDLMKKQATNLGANGYIVKSQIDPYEISSQVEEIFSELS